MRPSGTFASRTILGTIVCKTSVTVSSVPVFKTRTAADLASFPTVAFLRLLDTVSFTIFFNACFARVAPGIKK